MGVGFISWKSWHFPEKVESRFPEKVDIFLKRLTIPKIFSGQILYGASKDKKDSNGMGKYLYYDDEDEVEDAF